MTKTNLNRHCLARRQYLWLRYWQLARKTSIKLIPSFLLLLFIH